jgi:bromodomain-containing factor 1
MAKPNAAAFLEPVPKNITQYHKMIKKPMDFGTVLKRLNSYPDVSKFLSDVELIFSNCCMFNPVHDPIHPIAISLRKRFNKCMEEIGLRPDGSMGGELKRKSSETSANGNVETKETVKVEEDVSPPRLKIKLKF